jgi:hypothetical protein
MSVRTVSLTIPATGVLNLEPANFLFVYSCSASFTMQFQGGPNEYFANIGAGLRIARLKRWDTLNITGTAGLTIILLYGFEKSIEDRTDYQSTIATIAGTIAVSQGSRSSQPTDHADVAVASGATDTSIGVNAARISVIIGSLSSNAPATLNLRVRGHGDVVGGIELQPGTSITLYTQGAIDIYNGDANAQTYWWQEQT